MGLWIALAALAAGAGSAAAIVLLQRPAAQPASRLVVIEKHEGDPTIAASPSSESALTAEPLPAPEPTTATAPNPAADASTPKAKTADRPGGASSEGRGAELARAFQRQEGKIQSCFQQHATPGEAAPNISVRFQIDASGAVQNALVSPSSVAGTPLGQCIGGVARSTKFDAQPGPVSFSIPIAARVVRR